MCYPYLSYTSIYVSSNNVAATNVWTMMQTYLSTFMDPTSSYRAQFFYFSCAMLFPKCDAATVRRLTPACAAHAP